MKHRTKAILLGGWVLVALLYLAMKFYAQYRPVKIYVARLAPMPEELANGLHMEEHKINPMVTIESSYENSEDKILSLDEIQRIRSQISWSAEIPAFYDSLTIQSPNKVMVRRMTKSVLREYELVKSGGRWHLESSTRSALNPPIANN